MTSLPNQTMVPTEVTLGRLMTDVLVREVLVTSPLWPISPPRFSLPGACRRYDRPHAHRTQLAGPAHPAPRGCRPVDRRGVLGDGGGHGRPGDPRAAGGLLGRAPRQG